MIEMIAMIGLEVRVAFRRDSFSSYPHILSSSGAMRVKLACPPIYRKNVTCPKSWIFAAKAVIIKVNIVIEGKLYRNKYVKLGQTKSSKKFFPL